MMKKMLCSVFVILFILCVFAGSASAQPPTLFFDEADAIFGKIIILNQDLESEVGRNAVKQVMPGDNITNIGVGNPMEIIRQLVIDITSAGIINDSVKPITDVRY